MAHDDQHADDDGKRWAESLVKRIGATAKELRSSHSARWISDRTGQLGFRIPATVIAKLDSGHRGGVLSVAELIVLAAALDVSPLELLLPTGPTQPVEVLPGTSMSQEDFVGWFTGTSDLTPTGIRDRDAHQRLLLAAQINGIDDELKSLRDGLARVEKAPLLLEAQYRKQLEADAAHYRGTIRSLEQRRKMLAAALERSGEDLDA
ncbi:putative DNA-binding protein [Mycolicibacterium sp. TY66]|uniref:hypothetical protein n=1 Tax=Mycobacteriaceae TaxID=1762 RepID=UPI001BB3CF70|nr:MULTISPECIES: hypothetical protein [unclassified Mycolicibacterium]BCI84410.1 putative DNA-binding protein [Mycolicibacterium sp. TY66]BCJ83969.1 putative DNA-binding protein [Mycolicibacterium sp. TY81]